MVPLWSLLAFGGLLAGWLTLRVVAGERGGLRDALTQGRAAKLRNELAVLRENGRV